MKTGHEKGGGRRSDALRKDEGATTCWNEGGGRENVLEQRWGCKNMLETKAGRENEDGAPERRWGRDEALYENGGATTCWDEGGWAR